jgi:malate synthase
MGNKKIAQQAKEFLYELNNARHEYSFSSTDTWVFTESTAKEKDKLEAAYYPVLFTRCDSEGLPELAGYFTTPLAETEEPAKKTATPSASKDRVFLVAHCLTKLK